MERARPRGFNITDLTTVLTLLLIHLVENLLVRKFSAKQLAVARTALFVFFLANKNKKEECAVKNKVDLFLLAKILGCHLPRHRRTESGVSDVSPLPRSRSLPLPLQPPLERGTRVAHQEERHLAL